MIVVLAIPASAAAKPAALWVETVSAPAKKQTDTAERPTRRGAVKTARYHVAPRYDVAPPAAAAPAEREETLDFLGFSRNEAVAAFSVSVRETSGTKTFTYQVVRVFSSENERLLATFRQGAPSPHSEWQTAMPASAWEQFAARADLFKFKVHHARPIFRVAIDDGCKIAGSLSTKHWITVDAAEGSALGMTPVVRLFDGRLVFLDPLPRSEAQPGSSVSAKLEAFHSRTGMHLAVLSHFTRHMHGGGDVHTGDIPRLYAMPGDPVGTTTVGPINQTVAHEAIGERLFDELHPELKEAFVRYGRD